MIDSQFDDDSQETGEKSVKSDTKFFPISVLLVFLNSLGIFGRYKQSHPGKDLLWHFFKRR